MASIESVFPNPPAYYKEFKEEEDVTRIPPPPIPAERPPLFGNSLSHLSTTSTYEEGLDYLSVLQESLRSFRKTFARIVDTEEKLGEEEKREIDEEHAGKALEEHAVERKKKEKLVVEAIGHAVAFYGRLAELREHEAREEAVQKMKEQIDKHKSLLEEMEATNQALEESILDRQKFVPSSATKVKRKRSSS